MTPPMIMLKLKQFALWPLHVVGLYGTPDDWIELYKETPVPHWLVATYGIKLKFGLDCETYWDGSWQVVRPLMPLLTPDDTLMEQDGLRFRPSVCLAGAPTKLIVEPRRRPPRKPREVVCKTETSKAFALSSVFSSSRS